MKKQYDLSLGKLTFLKVAARKVGSQTKEDYAEAISSFFQEYGVDRCIMAGKQWEVAALFILGVIQASMKKRGIRFWICVDKALDAAQIDVEINGRPIQLKLGFSAAAAAAVQDTFGSSGIKVVNAPEGGDGVEIFREILEAAGFSEKQIETEVFENPGFDAAMEVTDWFMRGIEL